MRGRDGRLFNAAVLAVQCGGQIAQHPVGQELCQSWFDHLGRCRAGWSQCGQGPLEPKRRGPIRGEHPRIVVRQLERRFEPSRHRRGQFGHGRAHAFDRSGVDHQRGQIGIGEITIIVGILFGAHRSRLIAVGVVQARFLHHAATVFEQLDLAARFMLNGGLQEPK